MSLPTAEELRSFSTSTILGLVFDDRARQVFARAGLAGLSMPIRLTPQT